MMTKSRPVTGVDRTLGANETVNAGDACPWLLAGEADAEPCALVPRTPKSRRTEMAMIAASQLSLG
jgi:hypothetical protein